MRSLVRKLKEAEILTNSSFYPHGTKVRLEDGQAGRAQNILPSCYRLFIVLL
ncbi:YwbE family protein [Patescibacteria group bacterium]|nr:YwbE family protein [Patescibacteria group bacterium]